MAEAGVYRRKGVRRTTISLEQYVRIIMLAELVGIKAAAQLAIREGRRRVQICSDSKTALTALQKMTL